MCVSQLEERIRPSLKRSAWPSWKRMRCVASLRMMALGFGPHSASSRLSSSERASRPPSVANAATMRRRRCDVLVAPLVDQALAIARRTAGAELERVVDHREIALVVQEPFVGRDFGVDANPEVHVRLDAFGPRDRLGTRQQSARTAAPAGLDGSPSQAANDFRTVGLIYTRCARIQPIDFKQIIQRMGASYVAPHPEACVEDFDSRGPAADVTYCPNSELCVPRAPARSIGRGLSTSDFSGTALALSYHKRLDKDRIEIRTRRAKTLLHKQASKRPMSPAKAGLLFFRSSRRLQPVGRSASSNQCTDQPCTRDAAMKFAASPPLPSSRSSPGPAAAASLASDGRSVTSVNGSVEAAAGADL